MVDSILDFLGEYLGAKTSSLYIKNENGKLVYERELKNGSSPTSYGLLVAETMNINQRVLSYAKKI